MKKIALFLLLFVSLSGTAQINDKSRLKDNLLAYLSGSTDEDIDTIMCLFSDSLKSLIEGYQVTTSSSSNILGTIVLSPYFYQIISPATLYKAPLRQALFINWQPQDTLQELRLLSPEKRNDSELSRLYYSRQALGSIYTLYPSLVTNTQTEIENNGKVMKDVDAPIKVKKQNKSDLPLAELDKEDDIVVNAIFRKPNFWKFKGSNSLNLTQNYATDNWFQGKANHYNVLGSFAIEANFDNKRRIQLDNRLDLQLGFQTIEDNELQKIKPTNNLVRINSKLGIKAAKNWNYAISVKAETQVVPNNQYKKNGDETVKTTITDFLSPLNIDVAVGVDWKWNLKRFSGSLMLAPGTYNFKYVDRIELASRYLGGDREGHHTKHTFGPSATARFNWKIANNINWDSRLYWISNLHYTNVEFENTITFSINKYLTSKLFFYPRFNDTSVRNRMPDKDGNNTGTYWMFKEWLSLGLSYNW